MDEFFILVYEAQFSAKTGTLEDPKCVAEGLVLDLQRGRDAEEQEWSQKEAQVIIAHRDGQIADIPVQLVVAMKTRFCSTFRAIDAS